MVRIFTNSTGAGNAMNDFDTAKSLTSIMSRYIKVVLVFTTLKKGLL